MLPIFKFTANTAVHEMNENALLSMIAYAENPADCKRKFLFEYFGEIFDKSECNG